MQAIQITTTGGPEQLAWTTVADPEPGPAELLVRLDAAGVNFIDTYHRGGLYPVPLPFVPGSEGAGVIVGVGADVDAFAVGDRVAWAQAPGSYAELVRVPAALAVAVPDGVGQDVAAAVMLQGMTAHYLVHDTFPLASGHRCLIHAGAGGTGRLMIQMAKATGAEVFTTVGSADKEELARSAGADHVIRYHDADFVAAVESVAGPRALDVVYDGVGQAVFEPSLGLLRRRGMMVTFGNASGAVEPLAPLRLMAGSLYLTRPTMVDYVSTRDELERRSGDLFESIAAGRLDVRIGERVALADAAEAHRRLEGRATTGKVLLIADS
ncbi:MAG: quinone oxidoreductase family protein [Desertimonas sp.]